MRTPNLKEIEWAISDLEQQETSEGRYILLAALHICRDHMMEQIAPQPQIAAYSELSAPMLSTESLGEYGESDFLRTVAGIPAADAWMVMDELMDTLHAVNQKVYDSVMRKLNRL